jgi:mRNA interferase RelE/StbE
MRYRIVYSDQIDRKAFKRLPKKDLVRIRKAIEVKLTSDPELFGKPLRHSLKGLRSLRIGDYRVIFVIQKQEVQILAIAHRSTVYDS